MPLAATLNDALVPSTTVWLTGCVSITGPVGIALAEGQKAIPMTAGKAKPSSDPAKARVAKRENRVTTVSTTPETKERILQSINAPSAGQHRWPPGLLHIGGVPWLTPASCRKARLYLPPAYGNANLKDH